MSPHNSTGCHPYVLFLLLSTATLSFSASTSDSSLCAIPSPAPKNLKASKEDTLQLLHSFQLNAGYFFGGEDIHFSKYEGDDAFYFARSFSLVPHRVDRTTDSALLHVAATLTLLGDRAHRLRGAHGRNHSYARGHSVSFNLDGYYSTISTELCMDGSGTYTKDNGSLQHLPAVVLHLRVSNPASLVEPFVVGRLEGAGFDTISLFAYAEGEGYKYGEPASCPTSRPSFSSAARGAFHALAGANFSCARLKEHLVTSYKLQYGGVVSSPLLRRSEPRMHLAQVQCTADGAVLAYATFSNNTNMWGVGHVQPRFTVKEEAVVAEGRWDPARSMLCLRACRVVRSRPPMSSMAVRPQGCGIGMSFWFPAVWTIRDRSVVAGMLWNSSQAAGTGSNDGGSGVISVSSIDVSNRRSSFSYVKYEYNYTMVEEAKRHYFTYVLNKHRKKVKGSLPAAK